ncbi:MAG: DNA repair protein RecO, partial [Verrucomicrobiales bacterium]|nr:DNA repair protein RecO [Verrucomicrobiales bacterium]
MEERTTGIVLRIRPLTETSLIVQWLTADAGRISTVARGARRPKSAFRGKLDLFHEADLTFRRSRSSDLHTLSEVALLGTFEALRLDWRKLRQASYGVTLVELATEVDTPVREIWEEFRGFLGRVAAAPVSALPV